MATKAVFQVVGYKNTGKTTLTCRLIRLFRAAGYSVGTIKHDAHDFEIDLPGKDTWQHREAGAEAVAITSDGGGRTFILEQRPLALNELVQRMAHLDIVVVEGFKSEDYPKIVIVREAGDLALIGRVSHPIAVAAWLAPEQAAPHAGGTPIVAIDDTEALLRVVADKFGLDIAGGQEEKR
ncbi:molybdopterin-guanine dinucleotide biosynthesis protein B [Paenibacillus validus]|uniref:Molybdopterin-guanine dinucleotide biosynthesis protein B n=1 Tax=Paenibacillus validus TaxID=44253 RepID=A0A7X2ZBR8_9BACL|nr:MULTISPECIES: molybdopterin-guanine dinucleotide biosynthesis protein B [Paenibacillus]MED4604423.1 molybdopterin-guanine dinucleotide biosynthesis protein B [Paenibacillus validus]MED4609996.1 molybdopterin-guanine dinucleotide biosynthesis protein B [Paenibacillus validus]MUG72045.1 molybdopterin-guanine dinucleotide biosynthesis protein B [Paenibacillus validus]